VRAD